jgi:hypothetical protein
MRRVTYVISATMFLGWVLGCGSGPTEPRRGTTEPSDQLQDARKRYIQWLLDEKIIRKVDYDRDEIWVAPRFYAYDFKTKSEFIFAILTYRFSIPLGGKPRTGEIMQIIDPKTEKSIGFYDNHGLTMN